MCQKVGEQVCPVPLTGALKGTRVDLLALFAGEFIDTNRFAQQPELYRFSPDLEGITIAKRKAGSHATAHPAGCRYKIQFNTLKIQRSFRN